MSQLELDICKSVRALKRSEKFVDNIINKDNLITAVDCPGLVGSLDSTPASEDVAPCKLDFASSSVASSLVQSFPVSVRRSFQASQPLNLSVAILCPSAGLITTPTVSGDNSARCSSMLLHTLLSLKLFRTRPDWMANDMLSFSRPHSL